jgi:lipopolysaccharide/colanic/teichoic acid biosynthesis glycosyltransferase
MLNGTFSTDRLQEIRRHSAHPWSPHLVDDNLLRPRSRLKSATEFVIALAILAISSPVLVLVALLVKLTSRGPAIYTQTRLGQNGRPYTIYKFRTMSHNCELHSGPQWSIAGDTRITRLGRFLRQVHLDEFPQLWNVMMGEMALVGPRPERPEFVPSLEHAIPRYLDRLQVRPGITGFAQIQLPADSDLASVRRKLVYDLYYIKHPNLWLDLRIMICTGLKMFGFPYRYSRWVFFMPSNEAIENVYPIPERDSRLVVDVRPA